MDSRLKRVGDFPSNSQTAPSIELGKLEDRTLDLLSMVAIAAPPTIESIQKLGIDMFPAGLHTDSSGRSKQWTTAELKEAADSYNSIVGTHDAPILVGHDGNTSYGWLKRAYVEGDRLRGDFDEVDPAFAENAKAGRYKKKSISFYPPDHPANPTPGKLNIRHLAIVGIPAIKGLASDFDAGDLAGTLIYDYAEAESESIDHAEPDITMPTQAIAIVFRAIREWLIETKDLETADRVIPVAAVDMLSRSEFVTLDNLRPIAMQLSDMAASIEQLRSNEDDELNPQNFGETPMKTAPAPTAAEEKAESPEEKLQETIDEQAQMIKDLKSQIANLKKGMSKASVQSFAESLMSDRKITREELPSIVAIAMQLEDEVAVDFGEEGGSKTPRQYYLDSIAGRKELYSIAPMATASADAPAEFAEMNAQVSRLYPTANFSEESNRQAMMIESYMLEKSCSYQDAINALRNAGKLD